MKKIITVLSLIMLLGASAYGEETGKNKEHCDKAHFLIRMCGYYGAFGSEPCSKVLPVIKGILIRYGFTEKQATSIGKNCTIICSTVRDGIISLDEFEKNTNDAYLKCLQNLSFPKAKERKK